MAEQRVALGQQLAPPEPAVMISPVGGQTQTLRRQVAEGTAQAIDPDNAQLRLLLLVAAADQALVVEAILPAVAGDLRHRFANLLSLQRIPGCPGQQQQCRHSDP